MKSSSARDASAAAAAAATAKSNSASKQSPASKAKTGQKARSSENDQLSASKPTLDQKLQLLRQRLEHSFRSEFVGSLCYLITVECQPRSQLDSGLGELDWKRLEYSLNQLKKICKNKNHLKYLVEKTLIEKASAKPKTETEAEASTSAAKTCPKISASNLAKVLDQEAKDEEYFVLTTVIVRLLLKLLHSKSSAPHSTAMFDLKLLLLSCLADLCYYEELRAPVIEDKNLQELFEVFAHSIYNDIEISLRKKSRAAKTIGVTSPVIDELNADHTRMIDQFKKLWSKMVRLASNLCQDKNVIKIKGLFSEEFLSSLTRLIEQCPQDWNRTASSLKVESGDLDFYHFILRLIKYGCEISDCKQSIIQSRLLVYLSRFLYKYNKVDEESDANASASSSGHKYASLSKEMIRQYLQMLDSWPEPPSAEFYNQMIEGNTIEHLLRMQLNEANGKTITSTLTGGQVAKTSSKSDRSSSASEFNYSLFSWNLLYKFCRDYHACCSEFGRVGGMQKYIARLEAISEQSPVSKEQEFDKYFDFICLSCKEANNRFRLKEQGHLTFLIKLQQKLRAESAAEQSKSPIDSLAHNKLLAALCCFAHDQDSLNVLFANGLVDSLLAYLNDTLDSSSGAKTAETSGSKFILPPVKSSRVRLSQLLVIEPVPETNRGPRAGKSGSRKRKTSDSSLNCSKCKHSASSRPKRAKANTSVIEMSPNATLVNTSSSMFDATNLNVQTSPTGSCCSLSPPMSIQSPALSPTGGARCSSAVSMLYYSNSNAQNYTPAFSNSSFSPSSNGLPSPNFYWSTSNQSDEFSLAPSSSCQHIQFSPSIKNDTSDEEDDFDDQVTGHHFDQADQLRGQETELGDEEEPKRLKPDPQVIKFELDTSPSRDLALSPPLIIGSPRSVKSSSSTTTSKQSAIGSYGNYRSQQSIESINRTEACVFYVLSQLSHGEKPSQYLFMNFEPILTCLLNYLRNARVRNPRALRILNRLTKNHTCFQNFVLSHLPYKIKSVFYTKSHGQTSSGEPTDSKLVNRTFSNSSSTSSGLSTSYPHLNRLAGNDHGPVSSKQDELIEKEMHLYLSSNKVFFDEHMFFPSFESIDFTLCNNLKSHCISSSDHGYYCLTSLMKYPQRSGDRVSCALVAPFILRNSRALQNIMIQLNGLDLIIDLLLSPSSGLDCDDQPSSRSPQEPVQSLRSKAILCLKRILIFVNYKRDLKQINDHLESMKQVLFESYKVALSRRSAKKAATDSIVKFRLASDNDSASDQANHCFYAKRDELVEKSEYFNALLNGHFLEASPEMAQDIELKEVSLETFSIILDLLNCRHVQADAVAMETNVRPSPESLYLQYLNSSMGYELTIDQCFSVISTCDRFFLLDLKDLFISILICKFLSIGSWLDCFQLSWQLNSSILANSLIDYLLSTFLATTWTSQEESESSRSTSPADEISSEDSSEPSPSPLAEPSLELNKCLSFVDYIVESLSQRSPPSSSTQSADQCPLGLFRKNLKYALGEIIRCNSWKFAS